MAITATAIRTKALGGVQISSGMYPEGSTQGPVGVYQKDGAVYWTSGMSIDCDGQPGSKCNSNTDPYYQAQTAWTQSDGQALRAETLPFVVVPLPSPIWDSKKSGIKGGDLVCMVYQDKYVFGVVGDQGPSKRIGEASYAAATALGINPDPSRGGIGSGVLYIVFPGTRVTPIEDRDQAQLVGTTKMAAWLGDIQPPVVPPTPEVPPMSYTGEYLVGEDETLSSIAMKFKMTTDEIVKLNDLIYRGQVLAVNKLDPYDMGLPVVNSQSPSAVFLQRELKRVGYMPDDVQEHPNYGPKTQAAVAAFHNENTAFRDGPNLRDVTINRVGWTALREMAPIPVTVKPPVTPPPVARIESPVPGYGITYPYGVTNTSYAAGYHTGDDYAAPEGKPVVAVRDGIIAWADSTGGAYGKWLGLRCDNGRDYIYCHLSDFNVLAGRGSSVKAGDILGYVGSTGNSTGPHLHFEDRPTGGGYNTGRKPTW